jgi:glycosidase
VQDRTRVALNHRRLIRLRQAEPALSRGEFRSIDTGRDDVIAWDRFLGERRLTVIANLSAEDIAGFRLPGSKSVRYSPELLHGAQAGNEGAFDLAARTTYVFVQADGS